MSKSITDYGGLEVFLDGTKALHNGLGYAEFMNRYQRYMDIEDTYRLEDFHNEFGISKAALYNWLKHAGLKGRYRRGQTRGVQKAKQKDWL